MPLAPVKKKPETESKIPRIAVEEHKGVTSVTMHIENSSYVDRVCNPDRYWYARFLIKAGQELVTS